MYFDTHAHLDDARFDGDREALLERMRAEGIDPCMTVGANMEMNEKAVALAQRYPRVTAADISEQALDIAHAQAEEKRVSNLEIVQTDLLAYAPETRFDAMVFCLFGKMPEILPIAKRCCAGRIVVIKKAFTHHRFSMSRVPLRDEVTDRAADFLRERGVRFSLETREFEMGQPLRSLRDAVRFFEIYSKDAPGTLTREAVGASAGSGIAAGAPAARYGHPFP